jgi:mannosyltransferase OCH1-like enzyme
MTIPKIIWQTYKDPFDQLSDYIKNAANTWKKINLNYEYKYLDDKDAREFVLKEFGNEWIEIFDSYPLNVMRADLLRYMVLI